MRGSFAMSQIFKTFTTEEIITIIIVGVMILFLFYIFEEY